MRWLHTRGGALDFLGVDDGARTMPAELRRASEAGVVAEGSSLTPGGSTPAQLDAHVKSEIARWGKVVRDSGAKIE